MFGSSQMNGANAYAKVGVETGVIAASPHKLIVMLFDGAIISIDNAMQHLKAGKIAAKGKAISKAISIIDNGLRASLDKKIGGEIAVSLDALYEYMTNSLILANLNNQVELMLEVQNLLKDLRSSWEAITPVRTANTEAPVINKDPLAPRSAKFLEA
jgi:flagellar protein FliS